MTRGMTSAYPGDMEALGEASLGEGRHGPTVRVRQKTRRPTGQARGHVETLPSGSARIKVYAGRDALTGLSLYLTESMPVGPVTAGHTGQPRRL